jgi:hypothetical protein
MNRVPTALVKYRRAARSADRRRFWRHARPANANSETDKSPSAAGHLLSAGGKAGAAGRGGRFHHHRSGEDSAHRACARADPGRRHTGPTEMTTNRWCRDTCPGTNAGDEHRHAAVRSTEVPSGVPRWHRRIACARLTGARSTRVRRAGPHRRQRCGARPVRAAARSKPGGPVARLAYTSQPAMPFAAANFSELTGISAASGLGMATDLLMLQGPRGGPLAPYKSLPRRKRRRPAAPVALVLGRSPRSADPPLPLRIALRAQHEVKK